MIAAFRMIFKFCRYWLKASNGKGHGTHSPFVFNFITRVLNDRTPYADYERAEAYRKKLLADHSLLKILDLGAGSLHSKKSERSVSSISRHAAKQKKYAQLLYRIVKFYQPARILELGTSLGVSAAYLALGAPTAGLVSIEGSPAVAQKAREGLYELGIRNCEIVEGDFDRVLPSLLKKAQWDLVFVDGNHKKQPTLRYFDCLMENKGPGSILVFDDIHWSEEMEEAWAVIKADPGVKLSIDLFFIGLVFFREEFHEKQDFTIRF